MHAADTIRGPQRARTVAPVAVLLFTGARRVCQVAGADVEDLGTDQQRPVLWVTRPDGRRQNLALPRSAASPIRVRYW